MTASRALVKSCCHVVNHNGHTCDCFAASDANSCDCIHLLHLLWGCWLGPDLVAGCQSCPCCGCWLGPSLAPSAAHLHAGDAGQAPFLCQLQVTAVLGMVARSQPCKPCRSNSCRGCRLGPDLVADCRSRPCWGCCATWPHTPGAGGLFTRLWGSPTRFTSSGLPGRQLSCNCWTRT